MTTCGFLHEEKFHHRMKAFGCICDNVVVSHEHIIHDMHFSSSSVCLLKGHFVYIRLYICGQMPQLQMYAICNSVITYMHMQGPVYSYIVPNLKVTFLFGLHCCIAHSREVCLFP